MALSPYRFSIGDENNTLGRSRTGLSSVTAGGGGAGGEGYRRSALAPGSRGWYAAGFGNAPRTDYVAPTQTATVTVTPTVTPTTTATQTATPTYLANAGATGAEGAGAQGSQAGGPGGFDAGGKPGDMSGLLGDLSVDGKTVGGLLGGALGGLAFGPVGALAGAVAGRAIGAGLGGADTGMASDSFSGNEQMGKDMNAAAGNENASAGPSVDTANQESNPDAAYASGGRVTRLMKGSPMKGLHGVKAGGGKPQGKFMGGFNKGGSVPCYADGGMVDGAGLAGPNPPGPDDGYAALDGGEYVVRASQAQRPEYGAILDQMNQGTYAPDGSAAHEGMESTGYEAGEDDQDLAIGQGNMPPAGGEGVTPDDMMQRMAMLPPQQRAALQQAATDPMLSGALFSLLGPAFMQVISLLQQPAAPPQAPGMMSMSPDMAGRRPPGGGGLASVNA